jgi:Nif-specific regulatory protein
MPIEASVRELEWKVLYEISRAVGQALELDHTLHTVLRILSESLSMSRATVILKDEETGNLVIHASYGMREDEIQRGVYRVGEGVTGKIFQTAAPFVVPDVSKEPLFLNRTGARPIDRQRVAFLGVPILLKGDPVGVLTVDRLFGDEVSFERDVELLTILATLMAQFVSINRQVRHRERGLVKANESLKAELSGKYQDFFMVGKSPAMTEAQELVRKVAPSRASVLLLGESGTGKTLIARIIHEASPRAHFPFVKLNCAALPENLLESELFGFEKGAFTGATQAKAGRIEDADGGTLFLDEIGEVPLLLQTKLLRFIQERQFERLGSSRTLTVDVRIVAATNRDLEEAVAEGRFREDLYYRLNVFPIRVPPLRDRTDDITVLLEHFLAKFSQEYGKPLRLTPRARGALVRYGWPGNVREMENMVERLAILADGPEIGWDNLPVHVTSAPSVRSTVVQAPPLTHLKEMERREVLAALERNRWVQSQAARELGITLRQMGYRVKKYGLDELVHDRRLSAAGGRGRA